MSALAVTSNQAAAASLGVSAKGQGGAAADPFAFAQVLNGMDHAEATGEPASNGAASQGAGGEPSAANASSAADQAPLRNGLGAPYLASLGAGAATGATKSAPSATPAPPAKTKDVSPTSSDPLSIEAALAALGYGAAASTPSTAIAPTAATAQSTPSTPSASAGQSVPIRIAASASDVAGDSSGPQLANDAANWDLSGATPLHDLLRSDSALGLQSFTPRTHLAVANALQVRANAGERRAGAATGAPSAGAQSSTSNAAPLAVAASGAAGDYAAPGRDASSGGGQAASGADSSATGSLSATASGDVSAAEPLDPGLDAGATALGPYNLSQLPGVIADQADALAASAAPPTSATAAPTKSAAPQAVKELDISLDPADLGAVSVKMRLSNGKLSIVIGVSNATTLSAIEGERDAIAGRLGSGEQPLEDLVITSQSATAFNSESSDGYEPHPSSPDRQSSDARGQSGRGGQSAASSDVVIRGGVGDLVV